MGRWRKGKEKGVGGGKREIDRREEREGGGRERRYNENDIIKYS